MFIVVKYSFDWNGAERYFDCAFGPFLTIGAAEKYIKTFHIIDRPDYEVKELINVS